VICALSFWSPFSMLTYVFDADKNVPELNAVLPRFDEIHHFFEQFPFA